MAKGATLSKYFHRCSLQTLPEPCIEPCGGCRSLEKELRGLQQKQAAKLAEYNREAKRLDYFKQLMLQELSDAPASPGSLKMVSQVGLLRCFVTATCCLPTTLTKVKTHQFFKNS